MRIFLQTEVNSDVYFNGINIVSNMGISGNCYLSESHRFQQLLCAFNHLSLWHSGYFTTKTKTLQILFKIQ